MENNNHYLNLRKNVLNYSHIDMNLILERDNQVYIAVIDIPTGSAIAGNESMTLALIFVLNCHLYSSNGSAITELEKKEKVMNAMQSLLVSSHQILPSMQLIKNPDFYISNKRRVYLKTLKGIFFKELTEDKESMFINMLINNVLKEI